jgi:hypothetical protein
VSETAFGSCGGCDSWLNIYDSYRYELRHNKDKDKEVLKQEYLSNLKYYIEYEYKNLMLFYEKKDIELSVDWCYVEPDCKKRFEDWIKTELKN